MATVSININAYVAPLAIVLNYFTDGCFGFTTSGPAQSTLIMQISTDNGVTWINNSGPATSPRCGFAEPTKTSKYRIASTTDPIVYSNIVERVIAQPTYQSIQLSVATTDQVCGTATAEYRLTSLPFSAQSVIFLTDNTTKAAANWYSDGTNKGYWDGVAMSQFSACVVKGTYSFAAGIPTRTKMDSNTDLNDGASFSLVVSDGPVTFEASSALNSGTSLNTTFNVNSFGGSSSLNSVVGTTTYGPKLVLQPGSYTGTFSYAFSLAQGVATVRVTS